MWNYDNPCHIFPTLPFDIVVDSFFLVEYDDNDDHNLGHDHCHDHDHGHNHDKIIEDINNTNRERIM